MPGDQVPRRRALSPEAQGGALADSLGAQGTWPGMLPGGQWAGPQTGWVALDTSDSPPQPMPGRKAGAKAER